MRVTFLGGADEVGASCLLLEAGRTRLLVDCGSRMGAAGRRDPLPDLAAIGRVESLDAILVTHAHLDHSGALPLLHGAARGVPVMTTAATADLLSVLLADAAKIMGDRCEREAEVPLYPAGAVDALLARITKVPFLEPLTLGPGGVTVTFFPAGHVLGAAAVGIAGPDGNVLVTGDVSVDHQRTVPGMMAPRFRPDLVVAESTYGGRLHASRPLEERRLVETVAATVAAGGKVLVPAFALGRAQEVILILENARRRGAFPDVPVFVDGMVKSICGVYARHADLLRPALRKRILKRGSDPFFGTDAAARPVTGPAERARVLEGGACVIVASSGMLTGGASVVYAQALLPDPANLVCITGYQDEEAPGRRLLELVEGAAEAVTLGGRSVGVEARVERYALSAHADQGQLAALIGSLRPKDLALVHGDDGARAAVAEAAAAGATGDLLLPVLGEAVEKIYRRRGRTPARRTGIGGGEALDDTGLERLWLHLVQKAGMGRPYTLGALLEAWYGPRYGPDERAALLGRLQTGKPGFVEDERRPFLWRLEEPVEAKDDAGPTQQDLLDAARTKFGPEAGLLRCGVDPGGGIVLYFAFPDRAAVRFGDRIEALAKETGQPVRLHPEADMQALEGVLSQHLPPGVSAVRNPSVHREERALRQRVSGSAAVEPAMLEEAAARFFDLTGFTLTLEEAPSPPPVPSVGVDEEGRMEINASYARIRALFAEETHQPAKIGRKTGPEGPFIEVGFISPAVGRRLSHLLDRASADTGWQILLGLRVDQQALIRLAREHVAPRAEVVKGPSVFLDQERVIVKVRDLPPDEAVREVSMAFTEATGFTLELLRA